LGAFRHPQFLAARSASAANLGADIAYLQVKLGTMDQEDRAGLTNRGALEKKFQMPCLDMLAPLFEAKRNRRLTGVEAPRAGVQTGFLGDPMLRMAGGGHVYFLLDDG
jgi:hypothetical protein